MWIFRRNHVYTKLSFPFEFSSWESFEFWSNHLGNNFHHFNDYVLCCLILNSIYKSSSLYRLKCSIFNEIDFKSEWDRVVCQIKLCIYLIQIRENVNVQRNVFGQLFVHLFKSKWHQFGMTMTSKCFSCLSFRPTYHVALSVVHIFSVDLLHSLVGAWNQYVWPSQKI